MMLRPQDLVFERSPNLTSRFLRLVAKASSIVVSLVAVTHVEATNLVSQLRHIAIPGPDAMHSLQLGFQTVAKGYRSGVRAPQQVVVRTQSEWETLWRWHTSIELSPPPLPAINFVKYTVVGLFLGDKPTGGYEAAIVRAEPSNADLVILYRERSPTGQGMVIQSLTQPFHIIQVARAVNSGVIFRRES